MTHARTIRTMTRVSEDEACRLRKIATDQKMSVAGLLRECTLSPSMRHLIETKISDLYELSAIISKLDVLAEDALSVLKRNYPVFSGDGLIIESMVKEIDTEYGNLRELILKKREVYGMAARILIEKVNQGSRLHYPAVGSNCKHKIRVLVTEDEIERIRMMAKKKRCSISVLLKTNALNMYESETFKVNCDDLSELNNRLRRLMKFFAAVVGNVREGFIDDGDVSNIQEILKTVIGEIEAKGDSVRIDADAIMEDVRGRISKEWM